MKNLYKEPTIAVKIFNKERVCTISGVETNVGDITAVAGYAVATVKFGDLLTFNK